MDVFSRDNINAALDIIRDHIRPAVIQAHDSGNEPAHILFALVFEAYARLPGSTTATPEERREAFTSLAWEIASLANGAEKPKH